MLTYPHIDPIAARIGPVSIHWYGLMYLISFVSAWGLALYRTSRLPYPLTKTQVSDLIFYAAVGVLVGGRVGYMLFYAFPTLVHNPLTLFKVWQGGMSFHGGTIGVLISLWLFSRRIKHPFFQIVDFVAPLVPIGLAAGRLGNFINGELWGRTTQVPWAMVFPDAGPLPRHPSMLYECLLEGVLLFVILWIYSARRPPQMAVSGLFALLYATFRIFVEFFRQPDPQLGYLAFGWVTMGQLLSVPIFVVGVVLLYAAYQKSEKPCR